jgi:hypothetical protein
VSASELRKVPKTSDQSPSIEIGLWLASRREIHGVVLIRRARRPDGDDRDPDERGERQRSMKIFHSSPPLEFNAFV